MAKHAGYTGSWSVLELAIALALMIAGIALIIGGCSGAFK